MYSFCSVADPGDGTECKPPSSCLPDGSFGPVQCKGDMFTGRYVFTYVQKSSRLH